MTYVNPRSVGLCGALLPIVGTVVVALRFRTRYAKRIGIGADDWVCVPALGGYIEVLVWAEGGLQLAGSATHSFGWHSPTYPSVSDFLKDDGPEVMILGKMETAFNLIHPITLGLLKISICLFYQRIFRGWKFDIIIWTTYMIIGLWSITFFIATAAACGPHFDANWKSLAVLKQECVDTFRMFLTHAVIDVAVDLVIIAIPIPLIFGLQMPLRRKLAVCGIILVGALTIACGIARMVIVIEILAPSFLASDKVAGGLLATDDIGVVSLLLFWGMIEIGAGMIAVCLPALRPLLGERYLESMKKSIRFTLSLRSLLDDGINRIKGRQLASEPSLNEISREYIHHAKMEEGDMLAK